MRWDRTPRKSPHQRNDRRHVVRFAWLPVKMSHDYTTVWLGRYRVEQAWLNWGVGKKYRWHDWEKAPMPPLTEGSQRTRRRFAFLPTLLYSGEAAWLKWYRAREELISHDIGETLSWWVVWSGRNRRDHLDGDLE